MKNRTVNFILSQGFKFLCCMILLTSHVADGNVWGIYIEDGSLLIGDFWGSLFLIAIIFSIYEDHQETYTQNESDIEPTIEDGEGQEVYTWPFVRVRIKDYEKFIHESDKYKNALEEIKAIDGIHELPYTIAETALKESD